MLFRLQIVLYGSHEARGNACAILENMPEVKSVEITRDKAEVCLLTNERINENSLIPLLQPSGVSGFRLMDNH